MATLDTSQLEMSPVNSFALGTGLRFASKKSQLMSVTVETSQDPIGPCGPLEQRVDSFKHAVMAAWNSALDAGAHAVVEYIFRVRFTTIIRVTFKVRIIITHRSYKFARASYRTSHLFALSR